MPPNADLAREGERLLRRFEGLLSRTISLSNRVVRSCVRESGEIFTEFTDRAECQSQRFSGTCLERRLTARAKRLKGRGCEEGFCVPEGLMRQVRQLNRDGLTLVDQIINFKERLLCGVSTCRLFTVNYPLLIEHILREARLYRAHLMRLEGMSDCSSQNTLALTERFRDFKRAGTEGIQECRIRSIILPLLADHVLREANHYIRLLEE